MRLFIDYPYSEHNINQFEVTTTQHNITYSITEIYLNIQLQDRDTVNDININVQRSFFIVLKNQTYLIDGYISQYNYDTYYKYAELTISARNFIVNPECPPKWVLPYYREEVINYLLEE